MGCTNNNTDFQSELLQMNGTLQASITELRYHCEVYRLSLKSICKVLASVQKEQDARLRCLSTSRPTFQSYLLNLSQKQALDRIKNVVRKASTFINGYSLVDKQLFLPPPPKPSIVRRSDDAIKTAPAASITKLTDGSETGWMSESYSSGCIGVATSMLPVISKEISVTNEHGVGDTASSSNNNTKGKVEMKQHSSSRRKRNKKEKKPALGRISKSKSRTSSRSSYKRSSTVGVDASSKHRGDNYAGDNDRTSGEIKRIRKVKEKTRNKVSIKNKNNFSIPDPAIKYEHSEWKKVSKKTRSQQITAIHNHQGSSHYHHHHQQVINSRAFSSHQDEKLEEGNETGATSSELKNKGLIRKPTLRGLMSQSKIVANCIPPLLSITTSSNVKTSKTFGTSTVNEKLRTEARRVRRPSNEKQYEGRRANNNCSMRNDRQNNERAKKTISGNRRCQSVGTIRLKEIQEGSKPKMRRITTTATTRRWGNINTTTATKAGYKIRESLAVLRSRNSGNAYQGQGVVTRKYLFSSHHKPCNNINLNSATNLSLAISTEKVRRVQLNGSSRHARSFCRSRSGSINEEKPYGASRKCTSSNFSSDVGNGNGNYSGNNKPSQLKNRDSAEC